MKRIRLAILLTLAAGTAVADQAPRPDVTVYYFHGDFRCKTCLKLEEMTVETVRDSFATQIEDKVLELQVVNFMSEGNEHFEQDFQLEQQSVIVVERAAGKVVRWKNLEKIWDLHDQPLRFAAYVAGETRLYLDGVPETKP